jgi:hypothetical protein
MTVARAFVSNSTNDDALQQIHIAHRYALLGLLLVVPRELAAALLAASLEHCLNACMTAPGHAKVSGVERPRIV